MAESELEELEEFFDGPEVVFYDMFLEPSPGGDFGFFPDLAHGFRCKG